MTKTELFLEKYKELENTAVSYLNMPADGRAVSNLEHKPEFGGIRTELSYCREVRNLLSHKPRLDDGFAVEPSDAMIKLLDDTIERIKCPKRLKDIAVMYDKVLRMHPQDKVLPAMKQLKERGFSHAPIMEGGKVTGVFSISTVYSIILEGRDITPELSFADISHIVSLDAHEAEDFVFMKPEDRVSEAEELCEEYSKKRRRIGLILLTPDGRRESPLKGILTPWDVVAT